MIWGGRGERRMEDEPSINVVFKKRRCEKNADSGRAGHPRSLLSQGRAGQGRAGQGRAVL